MTPIVKKAFVVDSEGKPLLPTHPARARKLLKNGLAVVLAVAPFTIQLKKVILKPVGDLTLDIDDGTKKLSLTVVNEHTQEIVFSGTIKLRQEIKNKLTQRREYRRAKRYRKIRYQKVHFDRYKKCGSWLLSTIRQKKKSILRVAKDLKRFMNITHVVLEQGQFDNYYSSRARMVWRDKYTCQCGLRVKMTVSNKRKIQHRLGYSILNSSGVVYLELILNIFFNP
ncbi:MAG: hypothetical protein DRR00_12965 [Candidatus Parabeggiatoa sp. nov. 3]|nr:MAG: hypothetical protein DRR00_12965 [Gammaproteobacteria bacterium]RKZ66594.1 MAG: hypothetical protein DRQ99_09330 [Gammaproteobacteria bacterium]